MCQEKNRENEDSKLDTMIFADVKKLLKFFLKAQTGEFIIGNQFSEHAVTQENMVKNPLTDRERGSYTILNYERMRVVSR